MTQVNTFFFKRLSVSANVLGLLIDPDVHGYSPTNSAAERKATIRPLKRARPFKP